MEYTKKLSDLWHKVGNQLKEEMYKATYTNIRNLTMIDLSILQTIEGNPKLIFKEICNILGLPKSTLTSAVSRLEKKGFVIREISKSDMRKCYLKLTDKGKQAQKEHIMTEQVVFDSFFKGLTDKEINKFLELFSKALEKQTSEVIK